MRYLVDSREFLTPAEAESLQTLRSQVRYSGMHAVCPDCWNLAPECRCPPPPEPSIWRRIVRWGEA